MQGCELLSARVAGVSLRVRWSNRERKSLFLSREDLSRFSVEKPILTWVSLVIYKLSIFDYKCKVEILQYKMYRSFQYKSVATYKRNYANARLPEIKGAYESQHSNRCGLNNPREVSPSDTRDKTW